MTPAAWARNRHQLNMLLDVPEASGTQREAPRTLRLSDRLGRAGFVYFEERRRVVLLGLGPAFIVLTTALGIGLHVGHPLMAILLVCYAELLALMFALRACSKRLESSALYELPLFLESLILLVESGLSLLSAIEQTVDASTTAKGRIYIDRLLLAAREHSLAGVQFSTALRSIASDVPIRAVQHVLYHLELGSEDGGSVAKGLRALADYSHAEWQISISTRIKRLETFVVFPVFFAVVGLLLLTASGPLISIYNTDPTLTLPGASARRAIDAP